MRCPKCDGMGIVVTATVLQPSSRTVNRAGNEQIRVEFPDTVWSDKRCGNCSGSGTIPSTDERM